MLLGRDAGKLEALGPLHPGAERRVASVADPASLNRALAGAGAVINCAGPFLDTATPLIEAALRAGVHYLDVTAEQAVAAATFERFEAAALRVGVVVAPALAFYGGLAAALAPVAVGA